MNEFIFQEIFRNLVSFHSTVYFIYIERVAVSERIIARNKKPDFGTILVSMLITYNICYTYCQKIIKNIIMVKRKFSFKEIHFYYTGTPLKSFKVFQVNSHVFCISCTFFLKRQCVWSFVILNTREKIYAVLLLVKLILSNWRTRFLCLMMNKKKPFWISILQSTFDCKNFFSDSNRTKLFYKW